MKKIIATMAFVMALAIPVFGQVDHDDIKVEYGKINNLINYAKKHLGIPYRTGGTTPKGFDCSGFTSYIFSNFGYSIPRNSASQAIKNLKTNLDEVKIGDLIFFKGSNSRARNIGHVGIVIEKNNDTLKFIHSASSKGIKIDNIRENYYKKRYIGFGRVLDEADSLDFATVYKRANGDILEFSKYDDKDIISSVDDPTDRTNFMGEDQPETNLKQAAVSERRTSVKSKSEKSKPKKSRKSVYKIKKGDTLYELAKKNGLSVDELCDLNNISKSKSLKPGDKIVLN